MDLSSALMGLVFILLIVIPIYLVNRSTRKKREALVKELQQEFPNADTIIEYEIWNSNSSIIALTEKQVLFLNKEDETKETEDIDIQNIYSCKTRKEFKDNSKNGDRNAIEKLYLDFSFKDGTEDKSIPFFQIDSKNFIIGNEINLAEQWLAKIYKSHQ